MKAVWLVPMLVAGCAPASNPQNSIYDSAADNAITAIRANESASDTFDGGTIPHQLEACKAAIGVMMGREVRTMKGQMIAGDLAHVSYIRPDDGKRWQARCRAVSPGQIEWATFDAFGDGQQGRWRTEEPITFTVEGKRLKVTVNGEETGSYTLAELK